MPNDLISENNYYLILHDLKSSKNLVLLNDEYDLWDLIWMTKYKLQFQCGGRVIITKELKEVNENIDIEIYPFLAMVGTLIVFCFWMSLFSLTGKKKTQRNSALCSQLLWLKAMTKTFLKTQWPNTYNSTKWSQLDSKIICKLCSKELTWIPVDLWLLMSRVA